MNNKTLALFGSTQVKEAQSCADALLSDIVADAVLANRGKGSVPKPATLEAFRNALKSANAHCYQVELILSEFDALQTVMPIGKLPCPSVSYRT